MTATEVIKNAVDARGITVSELSRRTGINYFSLRKRLAGERKIKADELIVLCRELGLDIDDFPEEPG